MDKKIPEIGVAMTRSDAYSKVAGQEKYATDHYPADCLWCAARYSDFPHGLIKAIDISAAAAMPGVVAVLTAADMPGTNRVGIVEADQPILADDRVRCTGDPVALVLCSRRDTLEAAVKAVQVDYQELPGVFDSLKAMEPGSALVHEGRPGGNILFSGRIQRGSLEEALEESAFVAEAVFELPVQEHAYLETENGVARQREDGVYEMIVSTQTPFRDRMELARSFKLPFEKIVIKAPYLGGGFGGKDGLNVQGLLLLAVMHSGGRPVKMWNSREISLRSSSKRHGARISCRLGARADGELNALEARVVLDTGAYAHLGGQVLALAIEHLPGVYRIPNTLLEGSAVYTNNPPGGAFRGFGAPQALAAIEQMVDMVADGLGLDPLELRRKNAVDKGDEMGSGALMTNSTGIGQCLQSLARHPLWTTRHQWEAKAPPMKSRGVGIAAGMQGIGYGPVVQDGAGAKIELTGEGRIRIYCGISDMGQGNAPTNIQIAGTILNQDDESFELLQPDTELTLPSGSSAASRTTFTYGNALIKACGILRENITRRACMLILGAREDELAILPGRVRHLPSGREIPLAVLAGVMDKAEKTVSYYHISAVARHNPAIDDSLKMAGIPHRLFAFNAHLARIEVDEMSGRIKVCDYLAFTDAGQVLNPVNYEQQVQGGIAQGIGYALMEDYQVREGRCQTTSLATYIIPGALDLPDIESVAVPTYEMDGPFGMKGIGEVSVNLPLPAISNALARALGVRVNRYPLTGERVLEAWLSYRKGGAKC